MVTTRVHIVVRGVVQGVGFRPFVYRLATGLGLHGGVRNSPLGVFIDAEGPQEAVEQFLLRVEREKPRLASIQSLESIFLDPRGDTTFAIGESSLEGEPTTLVMPDVATCPECLADIFDPSNRRYLYPFTNCTHCGPRFTIITSLPYDRPNTSMRSFAMCPDCRREYEDPLDRRFHAQPIACPACGPRLALWDRSGSALAHDHEALLGAARLIREGAVVALKGLGGFQLLVDARNEDGVRRLRERKLREEKPFALMAADTPTVREWCIVSPLEARLLGSPEAPIVLLRRKEKVAPKMPSPDEDRGPAEGVAPGNPTLGIMLPYTPLHHILLRELRFLIVATSGNRSDEPMCIEEREAVERLQGIADAYLVHNRQIVRHADDSIVRLVAGRELLTRRARGFAPLPIRLPMSVSPTLAVGAHLKNAVAVAQGSNAFLSQHLGDLETKESWDAFRAAVRDLQGLFGLTPGRVVSDLHPDYLSSQFACETGLPHIRVQHHHAHVASCMAENDLQERVLGVAWDGTGLGTDGSAWGGEFLVATPDAFTRFAALRPFRLPGGDIAAREPRRSALGLLFEIFGPSVLSRQEFAPVRAFNEKDRATIGIMLEKGVHAPWSSGAGRLFDAAASLTDLRQVSSFEGQAAMQMEHAAAGCGTDEAYPMPLRAPVPGRAGEPLILDWEELIVSLLKDVEKHVPLPLVAARFHNGLVEGIVAVAQRCGEERVVLSGGCFQNAYLTERTVGRLRTAGFRPYWHQRVPPNDGGIALGQIYAATWHPAKEKEGDYVPGNSR